MVGLPQLVRHSLAGMSEWGLHHHQHSSRLQEMDTSREVLVLVRLILSQEPSGRQAVLRLEEICSSMSPTVTLQARLFKLTDRELLVAEL
jgi:hypothetical protein